MPEPTEPEIEGDPVGAEIDLTNCVAPSMNWVSVVGVTEVTNVPDTDRLSVCVCAGCLERAKLVREPRVRVRQPWEAWEADAA